MYVFVEIGIDINHLIQTILFNFHQDQAKTEQKGKIFLLGTVQFNQAIFKASKALQNVFCNISYNYRKDWMLLSLKQDPEVKEKCLDALRPN